jgi:hypothetical protein
MNSRSSPDVPRRLQTALLLVFCFCAVLFLGWVDIQSGPEVALYVFYLVPIVAATWFVNEGAGAALSLLSGGLAAYDTEVLSGLIGRSPLTGIRAVISRLIFFLFAVWLVGRLRRSMKSIRTMAMTDSLTDVYNARAFFDFLEKEMARSRRYKRPTSLMYLDLDNFKTINDTFDGYRRPAGRRRVCRPAAGDCGRRRPHDRPAGTREYGARDVRQALAALLQRRIVHLPG